MLNQSITASANSFDSNPRRRQELQGRAIADQIYLDVFGSGIEINRFDADDANRHVLDREHAIDCRISLPNGMMLTLQEKFLSNSYAKYDSLTVEYEQNPMTHEPGDWFKLASQLYFVGYLSPQNNSFVGWAMIDFCRLVLATQEDRVAWRENANHDGRARASFRYVAFVNIPQDCIVAEFPERHRAKERNAA